jgi:hypothetical protein
MLLIFRTIIGLWGLEGDLLHIENSRGRNWVVTGAVLGSMKKLKFLHLPGIKPWWPRLVH